MCGLYRTTLGDAIEEHIGRGRQGRALSAPPGQTGHGYLQCRDAYSARLQGTVLQQEQGHVNGAPDDVVGD